jgi:hypothetical protein
MMIAFVLFFAWPWLMIMLSSVGGWSHQQVLSWLRSRAPSSLPLQRFEAVCRQQWVSGLLLPQLAEDEGGLLTELLSDWTPVERQV